jgi:hypothetical protein
VVYIVKNQLSKGILHRDNAKAYYSEDGRVRGYSFIYWADLPTLTALNKRQPAIIPCTLAVHRLRFLKDNLFWISCILSRVQGMILAYLRIVESFWRYSVAVVLRSLGYHPPSLLERHQFFHTSRNPTLLSWSISVIHSYCRDSCGWPKSYRCWFVSARQCKNDNIRSLL